MKDSQPKSIEPTTLYTPSSIASIFEVDVQWVKKNLIQNRTCRYRKQGRVYVILGKWLIEWAETEHELPNE